MQEHSKIRTHILLTTRHILLVELRRVLLDALVPSGRLALVPPRLQIKIKGLEELKEEYRQHRASDNRQAMHALLFGRVPPLASFPIGEPLVVVIVVVWALPALAKVVVEAVAKVGTTHAECIIHAVVEIKVLSCGRVEGGGRWGH